MAWARLDDSFHDHPKVDGLSLAAVGLYTLCLTWAHRHRKTALVSGHITEARVKKLAGRQADSLAAELVMARLWEIEPHIGGWVIHDFGDYLPKERDPDERREAGKKGAATRWQGNGKGDGKLPSDDLANSMASDSSRASAPASPSRPVPSSTAVVGESLGDRPETLRAVPATDPPRKPTSSCTRHPYGNPADEPCNGCKADKDSKELKGRRENDRLARENERAARACTRCDGVWIVDENSHPTGRKCDHRKSA